MQEQDRAPALAEALTLIDGALSVSRLPADAREALERATSVLDGSDLVSRRDVTVDDPDNALIDALARAQGKFPAIPKSHTATVTSQKGTYTYNYADLSDVLAAVRPILAAERLAVVQTTQHGDGGKVILDTYLRHAAGGRLHSEVELGQSPGNPQAFGGALTYLRRYELATVLGIAPEEDRDAQDVPSARDAAAPPAAPVPAWATPHRGDEQKRDLVRMMGDLVEDVETAKALARRWKEGYGDVLYLHLDAVRSLLAARTAARGDDPAPADTAAEQDAAAERPDPTPDGDVDAGAGADGPVPEALAPDEEAELARQAAEADDTPLAGSVEVDLEGAVTPVEQVRRLKAAGCTCEAPLDSKRHDDTCPVAGHGIPF
jgi:hypothetical protein